MWPKWSYCPEVIGTFLSMPCCLDLHRLPSCPTFPHDPLPYRLQIIGQPLIPNRIHLLRQEIKAISDRLILPFLRAESLKRLPDPPSLAATLLHGFFKIEPDLPKQDEITPNCLLVHASGFGGFRYGDALGFGRKPFQQLPLANRRRTGFSNTSVEGAVSFFSVVSVRSIWGSPPSPSTLINQKAVVSLMLARGHLMIHGQEGSECPFHCLYHGDELPKEGMKPTDFWQREDED